MVKHITINGHTYASVDEMPPEVRHQYEAAMHLLASNVGTAAGHLSDGDVNISTQSGGSALRTVKTIAKMTASHFVVNGKEYSRWEDVPPVARIALQSAGVDFHKPLPTNIDSQQNRSFVNSTVLNSSSGVTIGLGTLIVLLIIALFAGILIGWKFMH